MTRWTPVRVTWADAHGSDDSRGWLPEGTVEHAPVTVTTVGLLYQDDERGVTVVLSRNDTDVAGYIFVPRSNVLDVQALSPQRP